jgi:pSer/pThr/pTyr-binding forkhead associated (FHA) protein
MPICPSGHTSASADFCDVCGDLIPGAPRHTFDDPAGAPSGPTSDLQGSSQSEPPELCPLCGSPRSGRFCEVDAYDFETGEVRNTSMLYAEAPEPVPPPPEQSPPSAPSPPSPPEAETATWSAVIGADRDYYESVIAQGGPDAAAITFPVYAPERRIELTGEQIRIGRRSTSRGLNPEIDLSEPPEDPGVSHMHAVLLAQPDGTWALVDPGSMNGTTLNGGTKPVDVNVPVPVGDGDRIHVGAWTTITLHLHRGSRERT